MTPLDGLRAHWLRPDLFALPEAWPATARLSDGAGTITLTRHRERDGELPRHLRAAGWAAWSAPVPPALAADLVRRRLVVTMPDGAASTGVQLASLLDHLYPAAVTSPTLGATLERPAPGGAEGPGGACAVVLRLWAPTAVEVALEVCDVLDPVHGRIAPREVVAAERDEATGVWTARPAPDRLGLGGAYRWAVTVYAPSTDRVEVNHVTDPYSAALTVNATASVVVDLEDRTDPVLAPGRWLAAPAPRLARQVDHMITELHVRDLSRDAVELPPAERGTFRAFTRDIAGTRHLRELAAAGVTTVHLLPSYDTATLEQDRTRWPAAEALADPAELGALPPDSPLQQERVAAANAVARTFGWGYDPRHVMAPEGSYAVDAHGAARCGEFREMVGALHEAGLAVVLDQVYNHTFACGQDPASVLCRVVPGYYSRLTADGTVETSTCCPNVATERAMAQRWMVDAVVLWARHYRVDGFRFDLMGHHTRENMLAVRAGLDELTLEADGVDGAGILLYGEGWNFGEVADGAQFVQAAQGQLGGTSIATFSDRLRDAVVGGTPSERESLRTPGLVTGLLEVPGRAAAEAAADAADLVRLGLAGTLRSVHVPTRHGLRRGDEIVYGLSQRAGYADEPDEIVSYIDAHDNETWYDLAVLKLPPSTPMAERVRVNTLGLAAVAWGQSVGFWHAGTELLRSKSLDHDSYDSGDWFNRIDWTGRETTFGSGLPGAWRNQAEWPQLAPLLADPSLRPDAEAIAAARAAAFDVLRVRRDVPLLRLGSRALIEECVSFPGAAVFPEPGLVAVLVDTEPVRPGAEGPDGGACAAVDPRHRAALVLLNCSRSVQRLEVPALRGRRLQLAQALAEGSDAVVRGVEWFVAPGLVQVPPLTAAVLVEPR